MCKSDKIFLYFKNYSNYIILTYTLAKVSEMCHSELHTWKILDEDLKQFMPESNRIIFLLPRQRPAASRTCRTLSEIQSPWYLESELLNHNLHLNYSPW